MLAEKEGCLGRYPKAVSWKVLLELCVGLPGRRSSRGGRTVGALLRSFPFGDRGGDSVSRFSGK